MTRTLADLKPDERAVLAAVDGERSYRRRLLELGFLPGTAVRVVRSVPVGDVLEVELRHSRVSLRISEAVQIRLADQGCATSGCGSGCDGSDEHDACATDAVPEAPRVVPVAVQRAGSAR